MSRRKSSKLFVEFTVKEGFHIEKVIKDTEGLHLGFHFLQREYTHILFLELM